MKIKKMIELALARKGWHKEVNEKGYEADWIAFGDYDWGTNMVFFDDYEEEGIITAIIQNENGEEVETFDNFEDAQKWVEEKMK